MIPRPCRSSLSQVANAGRPVVPVDAMEADRPDDLVAVDDRGLEPIVLDDLPTGTTDELETGRPRYCSSPRPMGAIRRDARDSPR
jgi:hypothetical protein